MVSVRTRLPVVVGSIVTLLGISACKTTTENGSVVMSTSAVVTDKPELLPLNSEIAVDEVAKAICDAKNEYNDKPGNISSCYNVTPPSWSKIQKVFYCQHEVWFGGDQSKNAVRACFTGTLQARGGYAQIKSYRGAYDFCIQRPEFARVAATTEKATMWQYIMMSQIQDSSGSNYPDANQNPRFTLKSQDEAIAKAKALCSVQ